ncbi:hypothetical protein [Neptunicoccus cionae]|uniref:hypothetical protein n=1 Tax=Neptunicoccus cionae TaxID=2035344 RepID=UPI000C75F67C|nr:hypothetical protein [Amylibacter cionae]PLS20320.1 hypothetical protein C0U40_16900 [Amylibacter cionae]
MLDYGSFCYLDVQKTGSSFVVDFLKRHVAGEPVKFFKHRRVSFKRAKQDGETFYFITARDPLDQYKSLYHFGLTKPNSPIRRRLDAHFSGGDSLYAEGAAGFHNWLEFMLDPQNARFYEAPYAETHADMFGYMTHRFLTLGLPGKHKELNAFKDREQVLRRYKNKGLPKAVIRNESLNADLAALIKSELGPNLLDAEAAVNELMTSDTRINASNRDDAKDDLSDDLLRAVQDREWFLFQQLGYPAYV